MTEPRYQQDARPGRKSVGNQPVPGNEDYFFVVNFNNGNVNNNHRDNHNWVRPVRSLSPAPSSESPDAAAQNPVGLRSVFHAWRQASRRKRPSRNKQNFEARWIDSLPALQREISSGTWQPSPTVCFVARRPKAREIHAPHFRDRVLHHWLVPHLERIYEPIFIHDSFANRKGKGTHAAVRRVQGFVRQVHSGQGGGWYLQLDVWNFFNSIPRERLWQIIKRVLLRRGALDVVVRLTHALLRRSPLKVGVHNRSTAAERALVPAHKRLANAPAGRGIPIGNLSSQFLANVLLNELDQYVKHTLKAQRYVRYVDDLVIIHHDRTQLAAWHRAIEGFLRDHLGLRLKDQGKLLPLTTGIDFLGYIIHPTHTRVRRRVISHARESLEAWQRQHVRAGIISALPAELQRIQNVWTSYKGHFQHADSWRLTQDFYARYPWLRAIEVKRRFAPAQHDQSIRISVMP